MRLLGSLSRAKKGGDRLDLAGRDTERPQTANSSGHPPFRSANAPLADITVPLLNVGLSAAASPYIQGTRGGGR